MTLQKKAAGIQLDVERLSKQALIEELVGEPGRVGLQASDAVMSNRRDGSRTGEFDGSDDIVVTFHLIYPPTIPSP